MTVHLENKSLEDLLAEYKAAAIQHTTGTEEEGEVELTNDAADQIAARYQELRRRGPSVLRTLLGFLDDVHPGVRLWAATHALEIDPLRAEQVLEQISKNHGGSLGFDAEMTLGLWRRGELELP